MVVVGETLSAAVERRMEGKRNHFATAELEGRVYVIGGWNVGALRSVEVYDPKTNSWSAAGDMKEKRCHHAAAALNGKIYVMGGWNGNHLSSVEVYDPNTNQWSIHGAMKEPRGFDLTTRVDGSKLYVSENGENEELIVDTTEQPPPRTEKPVATQSAATRTVEPPTEANLKKELAETKTVMKQLQSEVAKIGKEFDTTKSDGAKQLKEMKQHSAEQKRESAAAVDAVKQHYSAEIESLKQNAAADLKTAIAALRKELESKETVSAELQAFTAHSAAVLDYVKQSAEFKVEIRMLRGELATAKSDGATQLEEVKQKLSTELDTFKAKSSAEFEAYKEQSTAEIIIRKSAAEIDAMKQQSSVEIETVKRELAAELEEFKTYSTEIKNAIQKHSAELEEHKQNDTTELATTRGRLAALEAKNEVIELTSGEPISVLSASLPEVPTADGVAIPDSRVRNNGDYKKWKMVQSEWVDRVVLLTFQKNYKPFHDALRAELGDRLEEMDSEKGVGRGYKLVGDPIARNAAKNLVKLCGERLGSHHVVCSLGMEELVLAVAGRAGFHLKSAAPRGEIVGTPRSTSDSTHSVIKRTFLELVTTPSDTHSTISV